MMEINMMNYCAAILQTAMEKIKVNKYIFANYRIQFF